MDQTATLHVPKELYDVLRLWASRKGQTPDTLAVEWLTETIRQTNVAETDPLVQLFGTLESDVQDVAEHHDDYLGAALIDQHTRS